MTLDRWLRRSAAQQVALEMHDLADDSDEAAIARMLKNVYSDPYEDECFASDWENSAAQLDQDKVTFSGSTELGHDSLKSRALEFSDIYGCIDELALRDSEALVYEDAEWHAALDAAGFQRICGVLVAEISRKTQVAAALRAIGRPATKSEIAEKLDIHNRGLTLRIDAALSAMSGVVRATKTTWGFEEWVDDVYEGIPAEIRQRISEDGGATRLSRLLDEIPRLFGVRESSVRAYLETPAFRVEHGWVSEANGYSGPLGTLDDVADGATDIGDPFWTFNVEKRFLKGYSLPGVPPEVSIALGVDFGEKSTASVRFPTGCSDVSVIWRTTSMHGPEIGRLAPALEALQAAGGERVRLVIHGHREVSFARPEADATGDGTNCIGRKGADTALRPNSHRQSGVRTRPSLRARMRVPRALE